MSNSKTRRFVVFALLIWLGLIFATSCTVVRPKELSAIIQNVTGSDPATMERIEVFWGVTWFAFVKGWHFAEFAILLLLSVGAIRWWRGSINATSIVIAMIFCIAFAISDEWHQSFVPARMGTVEDVLIDSFGVGVAGTIMLLNLKRTQATTKKND